VYVQPALPIVSLALTNSSADGHIPETMEYRQMDSDTIVPSFDPRNFDAMMQLHQDTMYGPTTVLCPSTPISTPVTQASTSGWPTWHNNSSTAHHLGISGGRADSPVSSTSSSAQPSTPVHTRTFSGVQATPRYHTPLRSGTPSSSYSSLAGAVGPSRPTPSRWGISGDHWSSTSSTSGS
jgi:hypothetical protein